MRHALLHILHLVLFTLFVPLLATYVLFDVLVVAHNQEGRV